jgi:hypothetical protein
MGVAKKLTNEEGQRIKAQLIELGFWGVDEHGDPTANIHDAGKLNDRLQAKLAKDVFLVSRIPFVRSWGREVVIVHTHQEYKLAAAPTYIAAISLAALALPEFLRQHPECAAEPDQI